MAWCHSVPPWPHSTTFPFFIHQNPYNTNKTNSAWVFRPYPEFRSIHKSRIAWNQYHIFWHQRHMFRARWGWSLEVDSNGSRKLNCSCTYCLQGSGWTQKGQSCQKLRAKNRVGFMDQLCGWLKKVGRRRIVVSVVRPLRGWSGEDSAKYYLSMVRWSVSKQSHMDFL